MSGAPRRFAQRLNLRDGRVDMTHGSGGRAMAQLIEELFVEHLDNELLRQAKGESAAARLRAVVEQLEQHEPAFFVALIRHTYMGYYSDARVRPLFGLSAEPTQSGGYAVPADDPQVHAAEERGVPVLKYSEVLPLLAPPARQLAVAGTHGKTTVSWMLWHVLEGIAEARGGPVAGALIGGICQRLGTNALAGSHGGWFCYEACEYDRTFLRLSPRGAVVTNVEPDHLDYYGSVDAVHRAFACFLQEVASDGLVVLGRDVPEEVELGAHSASIWRMCHIAAQFGSFGT